MCERTDGKSAKALKLITPSPPSFFRMFKALKLSNRKACIFFIIIVKLFTNQRYAITANLQCNKGPRTVLVVTSDVFVTSRLSPSLVGKVVLYPRPTKAKSLAKELKSSSGRNCRGHWKYWSSCSNLLYSSCHSKSLAKCYSYPENFSDFRNVIRNIFRRSSVVRRASYNYKRVQRFATTIHGLQLYVFGIPVQIILQRCQQFRGQL